MISTPVSVAPNFQLPFVLETDAYDQGVGVVLSHVGRTVAFLSKDLSIRNQQLYQHMTMNCWLS